MSYGQDSVFVNQMGYPTKGPKMFTAAASGLFELVEPDSGVVLFSGEMSFLKQDEASGLAVATGDFTRYERPGSCFIRMKESGASSPVFPIGERPYASVEKALLKSFYYQRCGMELTAEYAGPWAHGACHLADAHVHGNPEERFPQTGGWHDAGDYGKYTVAGMKAIADLLLAYERFPASFAEPAGIPNSDGIPDVLAEVKYELEFLLLMQRPDGAVYHKVTSAEFPPLDCMPEQDLSELIFSPVSDTAAASFAAGMALAARIYREPDPALAKRCGQAAKLAWRSLQGRPAEAGFRNPPGIVTGEYGDAHREDELYWAAAELFSLTGETEYLQAAQALAETGGFPLCELGWTDTGGYGTLSLLDAAPGLVPEAFRARLLAAWTAEADLYAERSAADGFGISLLREDYIWGSNMLVMNRAMLLIIAGELTGNKSYGEAALAHWDYLLGRNVLGCCYVTGFGAKRVLYPHHRPSEGDGVAEPVPGMVAGGPNLHLQDEAAAAHLAGAAPAACFVDHKLSYSTNEMTIYWNSPAVFVAAYAGGL
ncbi:MAG: glycoside hydrolase [Paenibacillaceae bacterium]|nr:glycoside hydrolase [Paenibacillaceae bacterium]